jgi:hypothetical protein
MAMTLATLLRFARGAGVAAIAGTALLLAPTRAAEPKFFDDDPLMREVASQDASGVKRYEPTLFWDVVSNTFGRPGDPDLTKRARNVNTIDEVPDGEWFVNRAGREPITTGQIARGSNSGSGPAAGTWTVTAAKSDGITPGFTVRDATGAIWFLKFDPPGHPAMATGIEVTIAKLFWAIGYHTVEYYLTELDPSRLEIAEKTTFTPPGGRPRHMHRGDVDWLLGQADRGANGTYRVIASKAAPGEPVGRISFAGTRDDDPNDLIPHEHHRELRGYGVFAAWFNHVDAKGVNSIDVLVRNGARSLVRHYLLDFGSTMGSAAVGPREYWEGWDYLVEPGQTLKGMSTLGFFVLPWRTVDLYESPTVGRLIADNTRWDPERWKPRVPNPAFLHARADDKFWAARKAVAITDDLLRAAVGAGQFGNEKDEAFLVKALADRRDAIARRYLPAINPIVDPALDSGGRLQFSNAAVDAKVAQPPSAYKAAWSRFDNATGTATPIAETTGAGTTLAAPELPQQPGAYVQVAISATSAEHPSWAVPVQAYFRRVADGWKLVGFERLPDGKGPPQS